MLIVTTPNGIYTIDTATYDVTKVLKGTFFGIDKYKNNLVVAEQFDDYTLIRLLDYDFKDIKSPYKSEATGVHQIHVVDDKLFIADTKNDRIRCLLLDEFKKEYIILKMQNEVNPHSEDRHHINALNDKDGYLLIGLHKRIRDNKSSVARLRLEDINLNDTIVYLRFQILPYEVVFTHDLEHYNNDILISCSQQYFIYSLNSNRPLFRTDKRWIRGLAVEPRGIWVGYSAISPKDGRRNPSLQNSVNLFSHKDFKKIKQIKLPKCFQIYDMVYIDDNTNYS